MKPGRWHLYPHFANHFVYGSYLKSNEGTYNNKNTFLSKGKYQEHEYAGRQLRICGE